MIKLFVLKCKLFYLKSFIIIADFSQNIVNQRFKEVYKYLEKHNLIKGKSDIAKELGTYNHVINSILKGKRNITVDQLNKLFEIYNVNANFLFGGAGNMIVGDDVTTFSKNDRMAGGRANISLVPDKALAGYAINHDENGFIDSLQRFSIPGQEGNLIAFEISGNSIAHYYKW